MCLPPSLPVHTPSKYVDGATLFPFDTNMRFQSSHVINAEQPYLLHYLTYYYGYVHGDPPATINKQKKDVTFANVEPMLDAALGTATMAKLPPVDKSRGQHTALFMFWWFLGLSIVMLGLLLPNVIYRAALGSYTLILSSNGDNIWVRQAPIVLICVCVLPILTLGPLIYFSVKGWKHEVDAAEEEEQEQLVDANPTEMYERMTKSHTHSLEYTVFWLCTSISEAMMFWLAGGACGICEIFVLILGSISILGGFFIFSRLSHADRPLYQIIAAVISIPVPVVIFSAAGSFQSNTSGPDLASAYFYALQYTLAVGTLIVLSNADKYAFFIHDRVYAISAHLMHNKLRNFFLDMLEGQITTDVDGAAKVAKDNDIPLAVLRQDSARLAYKQLITPGANDDEGVTQMRTIAEKTIRVWVPQLNVRQPSRQKTKRWIRWWSAAFWLVTIVTTIMSIPGLDGGATLDMTITHNNCDTLMSSWLWPGGRVLIPLSSGLTAVVLFFGSFFPRFVARIHSEIGFQTPLSWRQLLTGLVYATLSILVAAAEGVTDVYQISMMGMCNLVAGFVLQRLHPYRDGWMTAVGYSCALLPWLTCVSYAHLTGVSPSRFAIAYIGLACALVWILFHLLVQMQWCSAWCVYWVFEFSSALLVFAELITIIIIVWAFDLLRS
jgi:hypothetical protein